MVQICLSNEVPVRNVAAGAIKAMERGERSMKTAAAAAAAAAVPKWSMYNDDEFMDQKVYTFGCDSQSPYHSIQVFTYKVKPHRGLSMVRTEHTVKVCAGPYGETVYEQTLPLGTGIADAKRKAIELALEANESGNSAFVISR